MTWDPSTYSATIRAEIHDYEELQSQVVRATVGVRPCQSSILTGELVQSPTGSSVDRRRVLPAGRDQTELLESTQGLVQGSVGRQGA